MSAGVRQGIGSGFWPGLLFAVVGVGCSCPLEEQRRPVVALAALEARVASGGLAAAGELAVAEAVKCRRLRGRLLRLGARPHALPVEDRVSPPPVGEGEAALAFFLLEGRYRRWLVSRGGEVTRLRPLVAAEVDPLVVAARDEVEHGDAAGARARALLARLGRRLLRGAKREIGASERLLVLPDGRLRLVPFHALELDEAPLVVHRAVARAPCMALVGRAPSAAGPVILVGPDYGGGPEHLAGARDEMEALGRMYRGARALTGARATPAAMSRSLGLAGARIHFSGHGLADLEQGSAPELIFSSGEALDLAHATARLVRAQLVVLSSCSAGQAARFRDGERRVAPVAMSDALLAAGAGSVVAASWIAKDRLAALQMKAMHRALGGATPDEALRRAQQALRGSLDRDSPRFWAPFAAYGGWTKR